MLQPNPILRTYSYSYYVALLPIPIFFFYPNLVEVFSVVVVYNFVHFKGEILSSINHSPGHSTFCISTAFQDDILLISLESPMIN